MFLNLYIFASGILSSLYSHQFSFYPKEKADKLLICLLLIWGIRLIKSLIRLGVNKIL